MEDPQYIWKLAHENDSLKSMFCDRIINCKNNVLKVNFLYHVMAECLKKSIKPNENSFIGNLYESCEKSDQLFSKYIDFYFQVLSQNDIPD